MSDQAEIDRRIEEEIRAQTLSRFSDDGGLFTREEVKLLFTQLDAARADTARLTSLLEVVEKDARTEIDGEWHWCVICDQDVTKTSHAPDCPFAAMGSTTGETPPGSEGK